MYLQSAEKLVAGWSRMALAGMVLFCFSLSSRGIQAGFHDSRAGFRVCGLLKSGLSTDIVSIPLHSSGQLSKLQDQSDFTG